MKLIINPRYKEGVCNNPEHKKEIHKVGNVVVIFCDTCNKYWISRGDKE